VHIDSQGECYCKSYALAKENSMKSLLSMIGIGVVTVLFTACAELPAADDPADDEAQSTDVSAVVDAPAVPPGSQAVAADPVDAGASCAAFVLFNGGSCPAGFTCLWKDANFRGEIVGVSRGCFIGNLVGVPCPSCRGGNFNDQMSSWSNRSGGQSCWWFDVGRRGTRIVMPNGVSHSGTSPANNDQASSFGSC